jgi:crossover junction endodeoxyribonuclease RusA
MTIYFHLPIVPPKATSQGKRLCIVAGKPMFFAKKEHQQAENDLMTLCLQHRPETPMQGPVSLEVVFTFPWRKSESKKRLAEPWAWNDTRPDLDNMAKLIGDVLTKCGFYRDDSQVAMLYLKKRWGHEVGITIGLEELEP